MPARAILSAAKRFARDRRGATVIEWTLIAALISIVLVASAAPIAETLRPYLVDTTSAVEDIRSLD